MQCKVSFTNHFFEQVEGKTINIPTQHIYIQLYMSFFFFSFLKKAETPSLCTCKYGRKIPTVRTIRTTSLLTDE